ncbi:MAG: alternative ribosome rescue aminoacyl-tRNA hydrolase ArfB [Desulfococcaceae bacterium]
MIPVTNDIAIDESALEERFIRSSGPGGQNVNKVATAVQLRYDPSGLPASVRHRLARLAGRKMTERGELLIEARNHRSQEMNRFEARERLAALVREAARPPRPRKKTRPSRAAKERRLEEKKRRGQTKRRRGPVRLD